MNGSRSQGSEFGFSDTPPEPSALHGSAREEDCRNVFFITLASFREQIVTKKQRLERAERAERWREGVGGRAALESQTPVIHYRGDRDTLLRSRLCKTRTPHGSVQ